MMKLLRTALALFLCVCLCVGLIPSSVAVEPEEETEISFSIETEEMETYEAERGVVVNVSNFPDPAFRDYVKANCDTDGDLVLNDREISAVTGMDLTGLGIFDLSGIEYFTCLETLNCSENNLRALNVSDLPYLEALYCQNNAVWQDSDGAYYGLEELIPSAALRVLWCYGNNLSAERLSLEYCPNLEYLDCSRNPLGSLDLSLVPDLLELRCNSCSLSQLDLSFTPKLCVLWCWSDANQTYNVLTDPYNMRTWNTISELDLSVCPLLAGVVANGSQERYMTHVAFFDGESEVSVGNRLTNAVITLHLGGEYEDCVLNGLTVISGGGNEIVVALDQEHFPDEAFLSILSSYDADADGSLSRNEISTINYLYLSSYDISSLQGIEYLTALTSLEIGGDGSNYHLSACKSLKTLNCAGPLKSLRVEGCAELTSINFDDSVDSLIIINCPALRSLYDYNPCNSLEISACPALQTLRFSGTGLTGLRISSCDSLTSLFCSGNQLKTLDLNGCPKLETLDCSENQIESLNVKSCTELISLSCDSNPMGSLDVEGCSALKSLTCSSSQLTSLNLKGCAKLITLVCGGNALQTLDLREQKALLSLDCSGNQLSALDLSNPRLAGLNCGGNLLTELDVSRCPALVKAVNDGEQSTADGLVSYQCSNMDLNLFPYYGVTELYTLTLTVDEGTALITEANSPSLNTAFPDPVFRSIVRAYADLDSDGLLSQEEIMAVKTLNVSNTKVSDLSGIELLTELEELNCSGTSLSSLDVSGLQHLETLYCQSNVTTAMGSTLPGARLTGGGLSTLTIGSAPLKVLWCWNNSLRALDLSACGTLEYLDCSYNLIENLDVSGQTKLTHLFCNDNNLTGLDLRANPALTYLWCWNNAFETLDISQCPKLIAAVQYGGIETGMDNVAIYDRESEISISQTTVLTTGLGLDEGVPITAQTFPDRTFRGLVHSLADINKDGVLSDTEAAAFESLDCTGWQISSLEGVNYLTGLRRIICRSNYLAQLDVSGLENLTELDCSYNAISDLNVNGALSLRRLRANNNQLSSLDLSACTHLRVLWLWHNSLSELDLSNCPVLSSLRLNGITETYGSADTDSYMSFFDKAQTGDLSVDTALVDGITAVLSVALDEESFPDLNFRGYVSAFDLDENAVLSPEEIGGIVEIDCSGLEIASLKGVEYFTALVTLDCSGNSLTALDLSGLSSLVELDCSGNALTSLDTGCNPALLRLNCSDNQLANVIFSNNYALEDLDCSHNSLRHINIIDCDTISDFIATGVLPVTENRVSRYSGSFLREDGADCAVLFSYDEGAIILSGANPAPDCVLPSNLERIEDEAFLGCAFTCVQISDGTTFIGHRAFADSAALLFVYIPESVTSIAEDAFDAGSSLVIFGSPESAAASHAQTYGFAFVSLS